MTPKHSKKRPFDRTKDWDPRGFPYQTVYGDHFESPRESYVDVLPFLKWMESVLALRQPDAQITLYDPYYCNGRTKELLRQLGFSNVAHEKRDFYEDVANGAVPKHHVLVTNPPYSDEHKQKCLDYVCSQKDNPFFLLMPNYVASRSYFKALLTNENGGWEDRKIEGFSNTQHHHIFFLVPSSLYQYEHPEGTGHSQSPFKSIWVCGIPKSVCSEDGVLAEVQQFNAVPSSSAKVVSSWSVLMQTEGLGSKRPNPKQRKKKQASAKKLAAQVSGAPGPDQRDRNADDNLKSSRGKRRSKYRDEQGKRKKKRF